MRIKLQSKIQEKSISELNRCAELGENAISQSAKSSEGMKAKNLYSIAECLDCSVDYLLGRTDNPNAHKNVAPTVSMGDLSGNSNIVGNVGSTITATPTIDGHTAALLEAFEKLDPFDQAKVMCLVDELQK